MRRAWLSILLILISAEISSGEDLFVSIMPQKYLVEQIAGEGYSVDVMVRPGYSPATYEPLPSQMRRLGEAGLFFTAGVPFEHAWVPAVKSRFPGLRIYDMTIGIEKVYMEEPGEIFNDDEGHVHSGVKDPHVWLDPLLFIEMGRTVKDVLVRHYPRKQELFEGNFEAFREDMLKLNSEIERIVRSAPGKSFAVFHPSWGYFARRYGLHQIPVEVSGKTPSPRTLERITAYLRGKSVKTIFIQKEFSIHAAEYIARMIGGKVVILSPMAYDYPDNLIKTAEAVTRSDYE